MTYDDDSAAAQEGPEGESSQVHTVAALARGAGVTTSTIYNHRDRPGFPGGKEGPWDVGQVAAYFIRSLGRSRQLNSRPRGSDPAAELKRKQIELAEEKLKVARGQVVDRDAVGTMLSERARHLSNALMSLDGRIVKPLRDAIANHGVDPVTTEAVVADARRLIREQHRQLMAQYARPAEVLDGVPSPEDDAGDG